MSRPFVIARAAAALLAVSLAAAACTKSTPPTPTSPASVIVSTSPTAAGPPTDCVASELSVVSGAYKSGAKNTTGTFVFTNTANAGCWMQGYPNLHLLAADGTVIPTTISKGTGDVVTKVVPKRFFLKHASSASFYYAYSIVPTGGQTCTSSSKVQVSPPHTGTSVTITFGMAPCGGKITVSAVIAGVVLQ